LIEAALPVACVWSEFAREDSFRVVADRYTASETLPGRRRRAFAKDSYRT
jgi:hypothetical protein